MRELALLEGSAGTALVDPKSLYMAPTAMQVQLANRPLPTQEEVEAVVKNNPLPGLPREELVWDDDEVAKRITNELLARCFPSFPSLSPDFYLDIPDTELDKLVDTATAAYRQLNMYAQIKATELEASNYKGARASLGLIKKEGLFRSGTFMRQELVPDLFMACPV